MSTLAVIGGSGLARLPELAVTRRQIIRTPYGLPSAPLLFGRVGAHDIVFLARHGLNNTIAPAAINYRANIWALHHIGIESVVSVSAVAALDEDFADGSLVVPHDLIDYTCGRTGSFADESGSPAYLDFRLPYDEALRQILLDLIRSRGVPHRDCAVYACIQGTRLPTAAESRRMRQDGADVYGMTGMPEAALARELDMAYAHLCGVIGSAAGETGFGKSYGHAAMAAVRSLLADLQAA